jgi:hypothetical protein
MSTWSESNFWRVGLRDREGWLGEQTAEAVTAGVGGRQIQVVLAVLKGESPLAGAARRHGVSPAAVQLRIRHPRLASPSNTAISVWPLADPLPDPEVPI